MTNFLLVHSAWSDAWTWRRTAEALRSQGHRVDVIDQLSSTGTNPDTLGDLASDAAQVRAALDVLGPNVVVVGHSYGGIVITEIADHPAIGHSVYLTGFWPKRGETLLDIRSPHPVEWLEPVAGGAALKITDDAGIAPDVLAADLATADFARFHREHSQLQSLASFLAPSSAPSRDHPVTYVLCEQDKTIFVNDQERMAADADAVIRIDSAHMAPLSCPDTVASALAAVH